MTSAAAAPPEVQIRSRLTRAARDVQIQRRHDHQRKFGWEHYQARVRAVAEARRAVRRREIGAPQALRQALIDLASCCEHIAAPMMAPNVRLNARGVSEECSPLHS